MKPFIFILLLSLLGISNAQQGNHLVVQGYNEILNVNVEPYSEAIKKTTFYDIDFNNPEISIKKIESPRIQYDYKRSAHFEKISPGYQSISNIHGDLMAYTFNNVLYDKNGDSIDYLSQYGGYNGIVCNVDNNDTFTLYYISSIIQYGAMNFEFQFLESKKKPFPPNPLDTFVLIEAKYFGNKKVQKKEIIGFNKFGRAGYLQSNLTIFKTFKGETKLQFVWDSYLYDINISVNYQLNRKKILFNDINIGYYMNWWDSEGGLSPPPELVVSPSGKWSVFNWRVSAFSCPTCGYFSSKLILIDNYNLSNIRVLFEDSVFVGKDLDVPNYNHYRSVVFTKVDSVFLVQLCSNKNLGSNRSEMYANKIIEITINNNDVVEKEYDIKLDSAVFDIHKSSTILKDLYLAPNGTVFAFVIKKIDRDLFSGGTSLFYSYKLASLKKNGTEIVVDNVLNIMEGVSIFDGYTFLPFGNDEKFEKIYFPATPIPYHYINFTNKSLCNDLTYEFTNETDTNWFDHFMWYWGDGDSSYTDKPQTVIRHQYKQPGKYRVLLKSITAAGGWVWYSDSVEILPEPIAKYHTENTVGCQWIAVEFTDSSILEKKAHTWAWDFGDGNDTLLSSTSSIMPTKRSIQHTYITSGQFQVQLRVSDGRCTDTFSTTQNIDILPAPRPGIAIDHILGCTPLEVNFGRRYSDPTDSTIYHFRPALVPDKHFDNADNSAIITQSGGYVLYQKLYGPSGCITQDSVALFITPGVPVGYQPILKRSTVINNQTTLSEWMPVPHAMSYQVYRNGMPHAVVNDTQFFDYLTRDINQSYTYEVQAIDSCDRRVANKSNMGKTIYLEVKELEPASKSEFATALLTWSPYEDWSGSGGVGNYESYGNYQLESESWERLSKNQDTTVNDKDFIKPKNYEKCYYVKAQSAQGSYESKSNVSCLKYQATLFAPNAFTPNGDGLNDVFEVFNYGFDRFTLSIYNSWGQKIYEQNNTEGIWAPTDSVPQGVYLYRIKAYRKNQEYEFSSTVTLLR